MRLALLFLASTAMAFAQAVPGGSTSSTSGGALTGCESPASATISGGGLSIPTGGGCVEVDTEGAAATDDVTAVVCPAGTSFTLVAANDARTVVLKSASFAVFGAVDQSLDQDGDYALGFCPTENTPIFWGFYDEAGSVRAAAIEAAGSGTTYFTEQAAPGAAATAGDHNFYFDSSNGRLYNHKNGGSALPISYTLTHATDCTGVTVVGTGVSLLAGDTCHELDADTNYVYDGAAWDLLGGGSTPDYVLYRATFGVGLATGGVSTSEYTMGVMSSTVPPLGGGTLRPGDGFLYFDDADTEIAYINVGILPSGYDYSNMSLTMYVQNRTTSANAIEFNVNFACPADAVAHGAAYSSVATYSTTQDYTATVSTTTQFAFYIDTLTALDATTNSSGCGAGDFMVMQIARQSSDANTALVGVWSIALTVPAT